MTQRPTMHYTESETTEERLRRENEELKRRIEQLSGPHHSALPMKIWRPSGVTIGALFLAATVIVVVAFFAGYVPLQKRKALLIAEEGQQERVLPRVEVIQVRRSPGKSELALPGNIQAITEAPILARADGYINKRSADIGDRVRAGQSLAEIEVPELDEQVRQAKANVQQAQAALDQALANLAQGKSDLELSRVTAQRWNNLVSRGVVSKQENDQYQAQFQSRVANVQSLEKAIAVQRSSLAAAEANVSRLEKMQAFKVVRAPFDGVITQRNVDVGALVNIGNTLLFRIAQTGTLRTYINVPQTDANSVRPGQTAQLTVSNLPGRRFTGTVVRTSNSLDPASRTLLAEVEVPNGDGLLLPGMYAEVDLSSSRANPPLLVPSDALVVRADGARVAVVGEDHKIHMKKIEIGRDYGDRLEVLGGLEEGEEIIQNPGDVAEGMQVEPIEKKK